MEMHRLNIENLVFRRDRRLRALPVTTTHGTKHVLGTVQHLGTNRFTSSKRFSTASELGRKERRDEVYSTTRAV